MIREATLEDLPEILRMGELFCHEAGLPFDLSSVIETVRGLIESPSSAVFVGDGAMAGVLSYPMFMDTSSLCAEELFWWVDEENRSTGIGGALVLKIEEWARTMGASRVLMSGLAGSPAHVGSFYEKSGYELLEIKYFKEI